MVTPVILVQEVRVIKLVMEVRLVTGKGGSISITGKESKSGKVIDKVRVLINVIGKQIKWYCW